jgi:arabinofuranan 3-O-arabinosyltransferase
VPGRHLVVGLLVLSCVAVAVALQVAFPPGLVALLPSSDMHELHPDFDTFRASAVALLQGGDIYDTPAKLRNLNPPLLTVLLTPFALLDALPAYRLFVALTLVLVVGAVLVVARELRLTVPVTAAVVLAVLASSPLHGTLLLGQIYGLLLVGLVAGWGAERRGHPLLAAACYGATVALKPSLAPLLLLAPVMCRWRPAAAGFGAAAGATLLGVLVAGPASGLQWLRIGLTEPVPDTADNASLPGLAVRLGLPSAIGTLLGLAVLAGTLAVLGRRRRQVDPAGTAPWAVLAAGLLMSPIAWHNYLMLLWPGILLLVVPPARDARTPYRPGRAAVLLAVAVIPVSWNALWPAGEVWALPGRALYCAVLLAYWWVLLSSSLAESSLAESSLAESSRSGASGSAGRVADGVAASAEPPTATEVSVTSESPRGSSSTASAAPGVSSSAGGSSSAAASGGT